MPYEDDYNMWLEKMLIESNPDWVCDGMYDMGFTHEWCEKYCGEDSEYVTPKCLHMYYHHIVKADRKTEPQYDFSEYADRLWKIAYERGKREALAKDEPQTCSVNGRPYDCGNCEYHKCMADEPQTEREGE